MSLTLTLEKNGEMRKLFGKRELFIIKKQLLGIPLKPSEKTRLSRDIRKKFEAIKILAPYVNEFGLKHGAELKILIEKTKESMLESEYSPKIKKIILFGSVAEKKHIFRSDIDIAIEFDKIESKEAAKFEIKFNNNKVQISVYNTLPEKIRREINEKGKIIYERKN